ncbi:DUF3817 domain-containing protein [Leucobacter rhizosphaerae]|uniref:DUF3817 domain-containing protein n=1 Tax=Leucobacter rhizosphaerae TaxID=2932245 RepID=A0ABY4FYM9_9MICO|nr:DUF3817 domain-containing protein [Leucobacter rhizosphaerae]UOQ61336.1 DUF3817 domain-containing protein [Leucobacter rhizosphaerae]
MQLQPKPADYPRIRKALNVYKVTSVITGVMLLLLTAVMIMKYGFNVQLYLFSPEAFAKFEPLPAEGLEGDFQPAGFDLFKAILIAHGWFYVVYLISDFMLWSPMRWGFLRFLVIALGGVIPFMSFFLEARIVREVNRFLAEREAALAADPTPTSSPAAASAAKSSEGQS